MSDLANELMGWHDCLDGTGPGNGRFEIRMENGETEQTRLNLRACLRDAADEIKQLSATISHLTEQLLNLKSDLAEADAAAVKFKEERDHWILSSVQAASLYTECLTENGHLRDLLERAKGYEPQLDCEIQASFPAEAANQTIDAPRIILSPRQTETERKA